MKEKIMNSGFGIGSLIFVAAVILALPLRIYQYVGKVLEPVTGFFAENHWSIYALYAVLVLAIVSIWVLAALKRKELDYSYETVKRPAFGALSGLVAAGLIIDLFSCMNTISSAPLNSAGSTPSPEVTSAYVTMAQMAVSLLCAVYFVVLCITSLIGKTSGANFRLLSLTPVLWSMLRMVSRFMRTISYVRVSELLFEMIMLVFMIMFFMAFAQCNSKVNEDDCKWKLAAYGLPAALMALVTSVPRLILGLVGSADIIYSQSVLEFSDLAIALFIIATVFTRVTVKTESATESDNTASEETPSETEE